jgi:hypothetical protein
VTTPRRYWFKAKSTGFGWSLPLTWQGWVVYAAMFGTIAYWLVVGDNIGQKLLGVWLPILACLPICWWFGEPMGTRDDSDEP